jgi:hypothetical protein
MQVRRSRLQERKKIRRREECRHTRKLSQNRRALPEGTPWHPERKAGVKKWKQSDKRKHIILLKRSQVII